MKKIVSWVLVGALMLIPQMAFAEVKTGKINKLITYNKKEATQQFDGVWKMNPDGTGRELLVDQTGQDIWGTVSADGSMMAYMNNSDGDSEIHVLNLVTGEDKQLTFNNVMDERPDISPDGSKIVFEREDPTTTGYDIYIMNVDGSGVQQLTSDPYGEFGARWSPDGKKIAYTVQKTTGDDIYIMNPDGTGKTQVTNLSGAERWPSWSKDGRQLVFTTNWETGIGTINVDGTGYKEVMTGGDYVRYPLFSEDGQNIIFNATNTFTLWSIRVDGSNKQQITTDSVFASDWLW